VRVDVTLDFDVDEGCLVKIQDADWEVNDWSAAIDLVRLGEIRSADWNARKSIQVGRSAGSPLWWLSNDGQWNCDGHVPRFVVVADEEHDASVAGLRLDLRKSRKSRTRRSGS
jgi:hypothetical protein